MNRASGIQTRRERASEDLSDAELFAGMADGTLGHLGELFDRHHAAVRAFAERILANPADADDLVQETFLTASRSAAAFDRERESAKPFLLGITAQLARRRRRTFARFRAMLSSFAHAPALVRPSPEEEAFASEDAGLLDEALGRLSHEHREAILLVDLGELSGVDAAKALGIPAGTIWRRLHEARTSLREIIRRRTR